ncbi:hypothetical protein R1flu_011550 [Riccia fluitans]|uniref:F-box domain-containing protein n=1 Tax=Riccia fluitans TaxID=41844 RepID=A0ABD1Z839_9MARC
MWGSARDHWYDPWFYPFPLGWDSDIEDFDLETNDTLAEVESDWLSDVAETEAEKATTSGCVSNEWSDHADVEPFVNKTHPCCPCPNEMVEDYGFMEEYYSSGLDTSDTSEDEFEIEDWSSGEDEKCIEVLIKGCPYGRVVPSLSREEPTSLAEGMLEDTESVVSVELPQEIITLILTKLPFHELCRLRTVCKAWNGLVTDPEFAVMCIKKASEVPYCVMFDHYLQGYSIYCPVSHAWRRLPRSFFSFSCPKFCLLAASGGILLYEGVGCEQRSFLVVNPINKSERRLPLLQDWEHDSCSTVYYAQIAVNRETDEFKVLIIDSVEGQPSSSYLKYQVYDSSSDVWEMYGAVPSSLRESDFRGAVLLKGKLYCLAHIRYSYELLCISKQNCKGETIVDSKGGEAFWKASNIRLPNNEFLFVDLFEHQGKLMLGGRTDDLDHERNLQFWRYEQGVERSRGVMKWVEVLRLPKRLRNKFSVLEEFALVHVQGDYIWASAVVENYSKRFDSPPRRIDGSVMVMSSISESNWCLIPNYSLGCPSNCNRDYCGERPGRRACTLFLFEPRLDLLL